MSGRATKLMVVGSVGCVLFIVLLLLVPMIVFDGIATEHIWLTTREDTRLRAQIYEVASHPATKPGVVVCHGLLASHQTMQSFSVELAKRGFLVVAIDLSGHGDSDGCISIGEPRGTTQVAEDDYVEVAHDASLDVQEEFTLSAWISAGRGIEEQIILNKEGARESHRDRNYKLGLVGNGALNLRFSSLASDFDGNATGNMDLRNAGWKYVVGVYNGSHCYLFVDGELQASDATRGVPEGVGADLWIGRGNFAGTLRDFNGTIDEVQISDIARSPDWIQASYATGRDQLLVFGSVESQTGVEWLGNWRQRMKISIDHDDLRGSLADFPVLLHLSNDSGRNHADVSHIFDDLESDAYRKRFAVTTGDGLTQCYVEIERWDAAAEEAWLWVKVPSISAAEVTDLYFYYDQQQADNLAYVGETGSLTAQYVWDDHFTLVTHMTGDPDGVHILDSTSNNNDGTKKFTPAEITGKIGTAQHFKIEALYHRGVVNIDGGLELDVRAGVDYLLSRAEVDPHKIAVLGHSLGGAAVFREGYADPRVKAVVAIAPASWMISNTSSPQNLLLIVGENDFVVSERSLLSLLELTTGGMNEVGIQYGNFSQGNARKLVVAPGTDHAGEMSNPQIVEEAITWVEAALEIESPSSIALSPWFNLLFPLSGIAVLLSVFPTIVSVQQVGRFLKKGNPARSPQPTQMGIRKLLIGYLLAWSIALPISLMLLFTLITRVGVEGVLQGATWLFRGIPLLFLSHLLLMYAVPCSILLLAIIVFQRTREKLNLGLVETKTGVVLGGLGFLATFLAVNVIFSTGFIDLLPTTRELSLMGVLFLIYLPMTFLEETWLRNLQLRLPSKSWRALGILIALYLLPRVFPLAFISALFGGFVLFAAVLLILPAFFTAWLFNQNESIFSGAIYNALFSAWIIAVVLPFVGFP